VFYSQRLSWGWRGSGMPTNSGLNTGLLISRDDIITCGEGFTLLLLGIKIPSKSSKIPEVRPDFFP